MDLATSEGVRPPSDLADIIKTDLLWQRTASPPKVDAEAAAMRQLGEVLRDDPQAIFDQCCKLGLELCRAESCGISLRDRSEDGEDIFRWVAIAGELEDFVQGTMPRFFSPCGVCVDRGEPLLMQYPERFYSYIDIGKPVCEVLLIPLIDSGEHLEGTIWIVLHSEERQFDGEDARVMQRLAAFIAAALKLANAAQEARAEASDKELAFRELDHRVKNTLAMTAGMLRYQLQHVSEPAAREIIEAASAQVLAVGRAHQIAGGGDGVDLAAVVSGICTELLNSDPRFELRIDLDPVQVSAKKASVVALVTNELVTNALKHGRGDGGTGTIEVRLRKESESHLKLSVADSGAALSPDIEEQAGHGLMLVRRLAQQLGGELQIDASPKRFSVLFPSAPCKSAKPSQG